MIEDGRLRRTGRRAVVVLEQRADGEATDEDLREAADNLTFDEWLEDAGTGPLSALERIGAAASQAKAWPVVHDAYVLLRQRYPGSPFLAAARVLLAQALLETGRPDDARRELEQITSSSAPVEAQPWMLLARARETTGDRRGAIEAYRLAMRDRDFGYYHYRLGLLHERRQEYAQAADEFRRLVSLNAEAAGEVFERAELLLERGVTAGALAYFEMLEEAGVPSIEHLAHTVEEHDELGEDDDLVTAGDHLAQFLDKEVEFPAVGHVGLDPREQVRVAAGLAQPREQGEEAERAVAHRRTQVGAEPLHALLADAAVFGALEVGERTVQVHHDLRRKLARDLVRLLKDWSTAAARMTEGLPASAAGALGGDPLLPPEDTGETMDLPASGLTITIGFGPGLFERDGESLCIDSASGARALLLCGEPIDEPIVGSGPFVMNTPQEIRKACDVHCCWSLPLAAGKAGGDLLEQPPVPVRIFERSEREVGPTFGVAPAYARVLHGIVEWTSGKVKDLAHVDASGNQIFPGDVEHYTSVVVPSLTLDPDSLAKISGVRWYEERLLVAALLLYAGGSMLWTQLMPTPTGTTADALAERLPASQTG